MRGGDVLVTEAECHELRVLGEHRIHDGQRDAEARPHPPADVFDEERLVGREPGRVETR